MAWFKVHVESPDGMAGDKGVFVEASTKGAAIEKALAATPDEWTKIVSAIEFVPK